MAYHYTEAKKKYTDVPMLDEIVHNLKMIVQDLVVKDKEEADNNESEESINKGALYISCMEGTTSIHSFDFSDKDRLLAINAAIEADPSLGLEPFSEAQIAAFVKSKESMQDEQFKQYWDIAVKASTQHFIDTYVETNNYYRMLNAEPDYGTPDLHITVDYIPKKYYKSFMQPDVDNRYYVPSRKPKYYRAEFNSYVVAKRNEGNYQQSDIIDDYYIPVSDVRYIFYEKTRAYAVNTETRYSKIDEDEYIEDRDGEYIKTGFNQYELGPTLYVKDDDVVLGEDPQYMKKVVAKYLRRVPLLKFTQVQKALLKNAGILEKIAEDNPERRYINYIGKEISYYDARKAQIFQCLNVPGVEELVRNRFMDIWEKERIIYLKRYYSLAYKNQNPFYDKFMIIAILGQVLTDMIAELPEWYIRRDVFDLRTCRYILEANGVKFFRTIPLKYQIAMVRRLNQLIKYKSTTRCFYDLCDIFQLEDVTIYKHYLVKTNKPDKSLEYSYNTGNIDGGTAAYASDLETTGIDGGLTVPNDTYEDWLREIDGGRALWDTNFSTKDDLLARYYLFFLRVPIGDSLDNYVRDSFYRIDYDIMTNYDSDPYWDGENDHETLKYQILQKDFTTQTTKYLSLNSVYDQTEYQFQMVFFMNLIMNNDIDCSLLNLSVPGLDVDDTKFSIKDLIILMYCFATKYFPIQLNKGIQNKVYVNNRDPKTTYLSFVYNYLGTYDPTKVRKANGSRDHDVDGGMAKDGVLKYYSWEGEDGVWDGPIQYDTWDMDGGHARVDSTKMIDCNNGYAVWGHNWDLGDDCIENLDYYDTELSIFDPEQEDLDLDCYTEIQFDDYTDMDGGYADSSYGQFKEGVVFDGGNAVNGYVYMRKNKYGRWVKEYENATEVDPCKWFGEFNDKFRYPTLDTTDRIDGMNMDADLEQLEKDISVWHPKFEWCRGYTLRDVLPTKYTPENSGEEHYFEYDTFASFPNPGKVGDLLQAIDTGKYYMWSWTGYNEIPHVYKYGIQDFMLPSINAQGQRYYKDPTQIVAIYERNKQIYEDLVEALDSCEDQDEYFILEYVYKYLFTMKWDLSYYNVGIYDEFNDYEYRQADTFQEFIENKNALLYQLYDITMSEADNDTRMYNIGEFVDKITNAIDLWLETDSLQYIYYFMPSKSWNMILEWLALLINFFKSYKTYMTEISAQIKMDDKYLMKTAESDQIAFKKYTYEWFDHSPVDFEYEIDIETEYDDEDFSDHRLSDRIYFDSVTTGCIDLNGGTADTIHYTLDFDGSPFRYPKNTSFITKYSDGKVVYTTGPITTEMYSKPFSEIDIDKDAGGAYTSDRYSEINANNQGSEIGLIDWDGGPADAYESNYYLDDKRNRATITNNNLGDELYPVTFEYDTQYIDLDGGTAEDKEGDDPVSEGYVNRLLNKFIDKCKDDMYNIKAGKYDKLGAADGIEDRVREYLDYRLSFKSPVFDTRSKTYKIQDIEKFTP